MNDGWMDCIDKKKNERDKLFMYIHIIFSRTQVRLFFPIHLFTTEIDNPHSSATYS